MKTFPALLAAHVARPVTTLCTCFQITRQDGQILRFTDHDQDLVVSGETYRSAVGYDRSAIANSIGAGVDNVEVQFITFTSGGITAADIRAGLYDHASVLVFVANWANPADGTGPMRAGYTGELTVTNTGVGKGELRGLMQLYTRKFIEVYSPECRADFGDTRCGFNLGQVMVAGVVTGVTNRRTFQATLSGLGSPPSPIGVGSPVTLHAGYFDGGGLEFITGPNAGKVYEVRQQLDGVGSPSTGNPQFTLFLTVPYDIEVGHAFTVYPGCDKQVSTCRDRYHNTLNFRGEPYVPGTDVLMNVTMPGDT